MGGKIRLLDIGTGQMLAEYIGHKHESFKSEACFTADDSSVVCGSENGVIHYYDFVTAAVRRRSQLPEMIGALYKQYHYRPPEDSRPVEIGNSRSNMISSVGCHPKLPLLLVGLYDGNALCVQTVPTT